MTQLKKKKLSLFLIFLIILTIFEITSFAVIKYFNIFDKYFYHKHQFISEIDFKSYLDNRDNLTGWPTKVFSKNHLTKKNYRKSPANEKVNDTCFSVYGDSYAFDAEVDNNDAWPNKLSEKLGCKVLNFGIPGFGLDQAYLRFKEYNPYNTDVIFTFVEGDYRRASTRMYSLQSGEGLNIHLTKPFYYLSNKKLTLSKLPVNTYEEYLQIKKNIQYNKIFSNDFFLPDRDYWSMNIPNFPYSYEIIKLFNKLLVRQISYSVYLKYYKTFDIVSFLGLKKPLKKVFPPPPSYRDENIKLNEKILETFINECNKKSLNCYIVPLPLIMDFDHAVKSKIIKSLLTNNLLSKHIIEIDRICLQKNYKSKGIKNNEIKSQLAIGKHYNSITSEIIAECLNEKLNNKI